MSKYFVTRHKGALEWAEKHGISGCELVSHFDPQIVDKGDVVIGSLPINIVAEVYRQGGEYYHLSMVLPAEARGKELTADDMEQYGARIEKFFAGNEESFTAKTNIGEWNEYQGEYGPELAGTIDTECSIQGLIIKLKVNGSDDIRDIYIERLPDRWRLNISMDQDDVSAIISLDDDGEIIFD